MKSLLYFAIFSLVLVSCTTEEAPLEPLVPATQPAPAPKKLVDKTELVEVKNEIFTEYYDKEKKSVKFRGPQDKDGKRHGKWLYFSETGIELTMTMYEHGIQHGHIIKKYPNGNLHYSGEFQNGKPVGVWKSHSIDGSSLPDKDYGYPEE